MNQDRQQSQSRRRPADVLLTLSSWPGSSDSTFSKVALDFAVINALGPSHLTTTLEGSGTSAATEYAERKRTYENTAARCRDRGVLFLPIVYTAQGALEPGAAKALEVIHRAAADNSGQSLAVTRAAFSEKVAVALVRANARAARRTHAFELSLSTCVSCVSSARTNTHKVCGFVSPRVTLRTRYVSMNTDNEQM